VQIQFVIFQCGKIRKAPTSRKDGGNHDKTQACATVYCFANERGE
jgi:hypothetical protein